MSYVDQSYYKDTYHGVLIPDDVLEQRLKQASQDIDSLTYNRINLSEFDSLSVFQKVTIKEAICVHADFYYQYGSLFDSPISSYSAGGTSVSFREMNVSGQNGVVTSKRAFNLLKQTGLTVRLFI